LDPGKDGEHSIIDSEIREFHKQPTKIVTCFGKAGKQLGILRRIQKVVFGIMRALIATVPTRWGTQVRQIDSLLKNKDALKCYADSPEALDTVKPIIRDSSFWERLRALKSLLYPFHEEQKTSESNHSHLNRVAPRWIKLNNHLQELRAPGKHVFWRDIESLSFMWARWMDGANVKTASSYLFYSLYLDARDSRRMVNLVACLPESSHRVYIRLWWGEGSCAVL
jgi:hypothetical protein